MTSKEKTTHEQGLVSVLRQIHDDLDAAVFAAYGWPASLTDEEILERLVALNAERAAEEARGLVRWLRPEFQNPSSEAKVGAAKPLTPNPSPARGEGDQTNFVGGGEGSQTTLLGGGEDDGDDDDDSESTTTSRKKKPGKVKAGAKAKSESVAKAKPKGKREWPKGRELQAKAVAAVLAECDEPATPDELARKFTRGQADVVEDLLQALATLGQARRLRGGKYTR